MSVSWASLGLPKENVESWFSNQKFRKIINRPLPTPMVIKNAEIPILQDYGPDPGQRFWDCFPHAPMPPLGEDSSPLDIDKLTTYYLEAKANMSQPEIDQMEEALDMLKYGAVTNLDESSLGELSAENSQSILQPDIAQHYTDTLASLIKNRMVAGVYILHKIHLPLPSHQYGRKIYNIIIIIKCFSFLKKKKNFFFVFKIFKKKTNISFTK